MTEHYALNDISSADFPRLEEAGFRLATFDLDSTIIGYGEKNLTPNRIEFFQNFGRTGILAAIISNPFSEARTERVRRIADEISDVMGRKCLSIVPDDVSGKKKPAPDMFIRALDTTGVSPESAVHFGDQVRTDNIGAKRANYRAAVTVAPMGQGDHPLVKALNRPLVEPILRKKYSLPPKVSEFPTSLPDSIYQE